MCAKKVRALTVNRDQVKIEVQQATDIVALIGEHIVLRARGKDYIGLCPFHDDTNPSMYVVPSKQIYKCFSCGAGGDVFSFMMNYHKMTFPEALRTLAERANIKLPERHSDLSGEDNKPSQRDLILSANSRGVEFFSHILADEKRGRIARDYLGERGISDEMIERFKIGYAPDMWDGLVQMVNAKRWSIEPFEAAGLVSRRSNDNGYYDRFRHRLIFPIFDAGDRAIAFGGRVLQGSKLGDPSDAKYLNSPETAVFHKSATLFGISLARQAIIQSHRAIIVEGYTDVIACHQAGICNVVATLGTALTRDHARVLRHLCEEVILVFDADEAGQKAADRAMEIFFTEPTDVAIAVLPDKLDPADLLAKHNGERLWQEAISEAIEAIEFHMQRARQAMDACTTITGKQKIIEDYVQRLAQLGLRNMAPARRSLIIPMIAQRLGLDIGVLDGMLASMDRSGMTRERQVDNAGEVEGEVINVAAQNARHKSEQQIVGCVLMCPSLFHEVMSDGRELSESLLPNDIDHGPTRMLYETVHNWLCEEGDTADIKAAHLRQMLNNETLITFAIDLQMLMEEMTGGDIDRMKNLLSAAYDAMVGYRAEEEYRQQRLHEKQNQNGEDSDDVAAKALNVAIRHAEANPSAKRFPRPE